MSFGFGLGDAALFTEFTSKVILSSKDEGGSKSQFQLAEQQYQGFLCVMNELQSLDLSNLPESFRKSISKHSTTVKEFVQNFRKTIAQYEKSMGQGSGRGYFRSAPRKVQWAFMAADDLDKSIVGNHTQPRPPLLGLAQSLAPRVTAYQSTHGMQGYLHWDPNPIGGIDIFHRVDDLTDIVYERLLARPDIPLQSGGRIHTLPNGVSINISSTQPHSMPEERVLQSATNSTEQPFPSQQEARVGEKGTEAEESSHNTLAGDINEYLRSFNLDELSEQEREYINQNVGRPRQHLLDGPSEETVEAHYQNHDGISGQPQSSDPQGSSFQKSRIPSNKTFPRRLEFEEVDAVHSLGHAAGIIQSVDQAAITAFTIMDIYRSVRNAPRELRLLSRRLMQYSALLQTAAEVIRTSIPTGELQNLGREALQDSNMAIEEVQYVLEGFKVKPGHQLVRSLKWQRKRKDVMAAMEEVDSVKLTLSVMLQLHQTKIAEQNFNALRSASFDASSSQSRDAKLRANGAAAGRKYH
ncbi:MAG: hypothetical protein M1834_005600 [Cirrosporium novae-zelandiae]|nr:MAG: hypothetical protein M1834_005600 [Cirrosporium novae-zelandiae]